MIHFIALHLQTNNYLPSTGGAKKHQNIIACLNELKVPVALGGKTQKLRKLFRRRIGWPGPLEMN